MHWGVSACGTGLLPRVGTEWGNRKTVNVAGREEANGGGGARLLRVRTDNKKTDQEN